MDRPIPDPLWTAEILPVAPYTRTVHALLPWDQLESGRYKMAWNYSVDIVGVLFTVIQGTDNAPGGVFVVPTIQDLVVSFQVSNEKQFTSTEDQSDVAAFADFADMRALDLTEGRRSTRLVIAGPGELGITFRWKRNQTAAQRTLSALISCSVDYRRVSLAQARAAVEQMTAYSR